MHYSLFEKLTLSSKAHFTWKNGVLVGYLAKGTAYMALYRIYDYYVEIQYSTCFDGIAEIRTFFCEEELESYLDQINLAEILSP